MYTMKNMTAEQVSNFVYWINEYTNLRGIRSGDKKPFDLMVHINNLQQEFWNKYPTGILTGWQNTKENCMGCIFDERYGHTCSDEKNNMQA